MRDPYLNDDVSVLKNRAEIKDSELLRKAEADITNLAMSAIYEQILRHCAIFIEIYLVKYLIGRENSEPFKW